MKIYLAAPYSQMELMREWEKVVEAHGHVCTAQWICGKEKHMTTAEAGQMDLDDIDRADAIVSYVLPKGTMFSSGGRHVEFGYALAKQKILINIGTEPENIFHNLVTTVPTIEHAMLWLVRID